MTDTHKKDDVYDGPPDHIPDESLNAAGRAKRQAAGRSYKPHPTHDYDPSTGELVPRAEKKTFFGKKEK